MVLDNAYKPDIRVKKEIETLNTMGLYIYLFCWDKDSDLPESIEKTPLIIRRIKVKTKSQLGLTQIKKLLKFYFFLLREIRKEKKNFDYIYVHDFLMLPICVYLKLIYNIPLIYDAHEIYHIMEWEKYNPFIRGVMFTTEKILLKFVNYFIVVNQVRKEFYNKYFNNEIIILGNWYDPYIKEKIDLRKELNIPENDLTFGYFGGLNRKVRRLDFMINSVMEIPNAHLLIAGTGHDYNYIEELAKQNNRIHFLGWLENVRMYLNSVHYMFYFINADRKYFNYAAPNTLYLALSHGIPLITNVPGEPEFLINKYNIGYFIRNDEKLVDKINLDITSDTYKRTIENIYNIKDNYKWSSSFEIYSKIFK